MAAPGASDTVVVVTGGDPIDARRGSHDVPAGATVDRRRLGHRPRPRARLQVRPARSATSTRSPPRASRGSPRRRARRSSATRRPRTPPTSSSPSTPPSSRRPPHPRPRRARRAARPPARQRARARGAGYAAQSRSPPGWARRALTVVRRHGRAARAAVGDLVSLLAVHGPARGVTTERPALPADGRGPAAGLQPRGQQRARRPTAPPCPSPTACCSPSSRVRSAPTTRRTSHAMTTRARSAAVARPRPHARRVRRRRRADGERRRAGAPCACSPTTRSR